MTRATHEAMSAYAFTPRVVCEDCYSSPTDLIDLTCAKKRSGAIGFGRVHRRVLCARREDDLRYQLYQVGEGADGHRGVAGRIADVRELPEDGQLWTQVCNSFHPEWNAYLQIGVAFVRAQSSEGALGVNVVPSVVGVRHLYNVENALQPYWGLGLGVQLAFGDFGPIQRSGLLPTLIGCGGLQFLFTDSVGVLVEIKTDLAQATLEVIRGSSGLGLHLDLSLGVVFHL